MQLIVRVAGEEDGVEREAGRSLMRLASSRLAVFSGSQALLLEHLVDVGVEDSNAAEGAAHESDMTRNPAPGRNTAPVGDNTFFDAIALDAATEGSLAPAFLADFLADAFLAVFLDALFFVAIIESPLWGLGAVLKRAARDARS